MDTRIFQTKKIRFKNEKDLIFKLYQSELFDDRNRGSFRMRIHLRCVIILQSRNSVAESSGSIADIIVLENIFSFRHIFDVEIRGRIFCGLIIA